MFRRSFTETPVVRPYPIGSHPPADQAGFLLPLSLSAALILLLSSLSLSAAALQTHHHLDAERTRQKAQDQLASAAHQLAGELQGPYNCLLTIPSREWQQQTGSNTAPCPKGLEPQQLLRTTVAGATVLLRRWDPDGSGVGGDLWLQVGENGLQKRYALQLEAAKGLREVS